jgi:hypothetical protein
MKKQLFPKEIIESTAEVHQFKQPHRSKKISIIPFVIVYLLCRAIFSDWEHFKAGLSGGF